MFKKKDRVKAMEIASVLQDAADALDAVRVDVTLSKLFVEVEAELTAQFQGIQASVLLEVSEPYSMVDASDYCLCFANDGLSIDRRPANERYIVAEHFIAEATQQEKLLAVAALPRLIEELRMRRDTVFPKSLRSIENILAALKATRG